MMRYPIAIENGNHSTAYDVVVPDLPGCYSAGDTLDEAVVNAEDAIVLWIETALDWAQDIPAPSPLDAIRARGDFSGWTLALVSVDPAALDDTIERVNIALPRRVLHRLDQRAKAVGDRLYRQTGAELRA